MEKQIQDKSLVLEQYELQAEPVYKFQMNRRKFFHVLGSGLAITFSNTKLKGDPHPNTTRITVTRGSQEAVVVGSSLGAGRVLITSIDGFPVEVTGAYPTLVFVAHDEPGIVAHVTNLLAREGDNIATMRVSRRAKGGEAIHIYELDAPASAGALDAMRVLPAVRMLRSVQRIA